MEKTAQSEKDLDIIERTFYYPSMRTKDEQKKEALFEATIKLVNEIGFAAASVSKIAGEAEVSSSTIYVFFKNKEDLLVSTYMEIKHRLSAALLENFDDTLPIRDIIRGFWFAMFEHISKNRKYFDYAEQFANSPFSALVDREMLEKEHAPIIKVFRKGIEQKIIKDVDMDIITAFMFAPISRLANPRICQHVEINEGKLEAAFTMAWDAIKL